jgi:hypothetical protein
MRSSYLANDLGKILKTYVLAFKPSRAVELGVLDGYSTYHIAEAIKQIKETQNWAPPFDAYDLFDDYQYKHGSQQEVQDMINSKGLGEFVNLKKGDAYEVYKNYEDARIDFIHVDLSNTGDVLKKFLEIWHTKIAPRCIILFEGGSEERDNIEWMKKYNMPSIRKELNTNPMVEKYYITGIYYQFPSITLLMRKWWL